MATTFTCPKGHDSVDEDFCSECGTKIQGAAVTPGVPSAQACPDCNAPAPPAGINFCEICGYNFKTRSSGQVPSPPTRPNNFKVVVTVDPTLRTAESPEAPLNTSPITYSLDKPINLIGRKSEARAIFPEIPLDADSAISHRHGIITKTPGGLIYRDLTSSNGTRLNGADVSPLLDTPLKVGDQLTLGHWTRISVEVNS